MKLLSLVMNDYYNFVYMGLVLVHSLFLAFERQIDNKEVLEGLSFMLLGITICFLFDSVAKIIVMGLFNHKNAYLRDPFNVFDIFIVFLG